MVKKGFFRQLEAFADGKFCGMVVMKGRISNPFSSEHGVSLPPYFLASVTELAGQYHDARDLFEILLD